MKKPSLKERFKKVSAKKVAFYIGGLIRSYVFWPFFSSTRRMVAVFLTTTALHSAGSYFLPTLEDVQDDLKIKDEVKDYADRGIAIPHEDHLIEANEIARAELTSLYSILSSYKALVRKWKKSSRDRREILDQYAHLPPLAQRRIAHAFQRETIRRHEDMKTIEYLTMICLNLIIYLQHGRSPYVAHKSHHL